MDVTGYHIKLNAFTHEFEINIIISVTLIEKIHLSGG
jgi:hypothetical protein